MKARGVPYRDAQRELDLVADNTFVDIPWREVQRVLCLAPDVKAEAVRPLFARAGCEVTVADRPDLAAHAGRDFDLVYQPVSGAPVADPARLYREVAGVLRAGGLYAVEHRNPLRPQLDGRWSGTGYRIVRLRRQGLSSLLGTLCDSGFVVEACAQRDHGDAGAAPGSGEHLDAFVPPRLAVLARLVTR